MTISTEVPESPIQIFLDKVWDEFGSQSGWQILSNLSHLAKDPFRWHTVLEAFSRASTWPGTGLGYRLLLGSVLLGERKVTCDSSCVYCGQKSNFQIFLHSVFTALNYPRAPSVGNSSPSNMAGGEGFINTFVRFLIDLFVSEKSPFRAELYHLVHSLSASDKSCVISRLPGLVTFFRKLDHDEGRDWFFEKLAKWFRIDIGSLGRSKELSISSFFFVMAAKGWEAATVEGGRRFDRIMISGVGEFFALEKLTVHASLIPPAKIPRTQNLNHPEIVARSTIELVRCSIAALFIPPTDWGAITGSTSIPVENFLRSGKPLERCSAFMEPSTVLMILRHMLSRPGAIPNLKGNNEGRFDYSVENIQTKNFDLSRSLCNVKVIKSATIGDTTTSRADLVVTVKEVNLQIDHDWHIEWTGQKFVSYRGTNTVTVRGLSCQIFLSLFADDQGPVVTRASISLGSVEHSCKIGNASLVSEILAQTALDWFAEPLTRLLQSASQSAVDQLLKELNLQFRVDVWNGLVLRIFPQSVIQDIVCSIRDHLPAHGVPL